MKKSLFRLSSPLLLLCLMGFTGPARWPLAPLRAAVVAPETFETGTKPDYPTGTVAFATGSWMLADALVGTDAADHKNGAQVVRLQQAGTLTMNFYLPDGAAP